MKKEDVYIGQRVVANKTYGVVSIDDVGTVIKLETKYDNDIVGIVWDDLNGKGHNFNESIDYNRNGYNIPVSLIEPDKSVIDSFYWI